MTDVETDIPQTNGHSNYEDDNREKMRPADIDAV